MLHEFLENFLHNLFKPLLLFFYFGFLIPIFKVDFEFPYAIYQGLTMYLLVSIGWHGGEELAKIGASSIGHLIGFMVTGFALNFLIGVIAYFLLSRLTALRRVDRATVAGYYGSDSAGTFATCVAVLTSAGIAFNAYMPVMLAVMEVPGCLVALYLVARLRHRGMDADGYMPDEPGYTAPVTAPAMVGPGAATQPAQGQPLEEFTRDPQIEDEVEFALRKRKRPAWNRIGGTAPKQSMFSAPAVARSLPQPRVMSAFWRHHHRLHQRVAGTEGRAGWGRFLRPRLPGCALPILARDGYDGIP